MRVSFLPLLAAAVLAASGCRDPKIESYRVPSETPEPLPPVLTGVAANTPATPSATNAPATAPRASGDMASTAVPTATGEALTWTAPAHWAPKQASAMRKGSYAIKDDSGAEADFAITAFPGDVGGELANINRWRNQLGLPPLNAADGAGAVTRLEHDGLSFGVVEFVNQEFTPPQRMLGAFVPYEGATWFFKLTGPEALVAREKPAFLELLRTVKAPAPATR